jgi:hypothetical protein
MGSFLESRRALRVGAALCVLVVGGAFAGAEEMAHLRPAAGIFEFNLHTASAPELGLQYRIGRNTGPLHPLLGAMATTDGAFFVYAGFGIDIRLGGRFVLRPSLAPGLYHQGQAKDLGSTLQFRTGVEVAWRLSSGFRLGVEMDHISNGGYADTNRGAESLMVTVAVPLGRR